MVIHKVIEPPKVEKGKSSYTSAELAKYFDVATSQLMLDLKEIKFAEAESWIHVRNSLIF